MKDAGVSRACDIEITSVSCYNNGIGNPLFGIESEICKSTNLKMIIKFVI